MNYLLDTYVLLWWLEGNERLRPSDRTIIEDRDSENLVSVVSLWEIVIKVRVGKLGVDMAGVEHAIVTLGFQKLWISPEHVAVLDRIAHRPSRSA